MKKKIVRDIATVLIAKAGKQFDIFSFDESGKTEADRVKILNEIQYQCSRMIHKIENYYGISLGNTTDGIIEQFKEFQTNKTE